MADKKEKALKFLLFRYLILLFLGIVYPFFSFIVLYFTIYPSYFLLNFFYEASVSGYVLNVSGFEIGIVSACLAGPAYYLLLILNLTTSLDLKKRISSVFFSFGSLWMFNVFRIFLFSVLLVENFFYFDLLHNFFWHFMSLLLVVLIWFLTVWIFGIKKVPVYSDLTFVFSNIVSDKNRKNSCKHEKQR